MARRTIIGVLAGALLSSSGCWYEPERSAIFVDEPVREIRIDSDDAELEVIGAPQDWIGIELVRWSTDDRPRVDVDLRNDLLDVEYACDDRDEPCAAHIEITLPPATEVVVLADDGNVQLTDIEGEISIVGDWSDVWGFDLASPWVRVETNGGNVTLRHDVAPEMLSVSTVGGSVDVVVPPGGYALALESCHGEVFVSPEIEEEPGSPHLIEISSEGGHVFVRASDRTTVPGGPARDR